MRPTYTVKNSADVTLVTATAKSVVGVQAGAQYGLEVVGLTVGFKGVTANAPVLVELCRATFASNAPGTNSNSTAAAPTQDSGRVLTGGPFISGGENWTAEPTVLTVLDEWELTPNGGLLVLNFADAGYDCDVSNGFVLRLTAPTGEASIVRASLRVARI